MKVAIMGAGLSGLACAITLEKHGISPAVFEVSERLGDRFVNAESMLSILQKPITDPVAFFAEKNGIYLKPTASIQRLLVFSQSQKAEIEGSLGFINYRGRHEHAFERQLGRQVKSAIQYRSKATYEELLMEYTHVVVATGDGEYTRKMHNFRTDLTVSLKGAMVTGDFDRYTPCAWLDYSYMEKGYGYLLPLSDTEANLVMAYPDYPENDRLDVDERWGLFYERVCRDLRQPLRITSHFHVTGYPIGICRRARIGNTFFVGNCFGALMPFLGFGQFTALLTGIYAAYDICGKGAYEELTQPLRRSYENSLVLRRAVERLDNEDLDRIVPVLGSRWGESILQGKSFNALRWLAFALRPWMTKR
ncbi:NAD(P)/FAD-dependent oxidoreductase [Brevibacillus borstelensis]|uniref:NAD(P)/FAD-dependent oxidoreductase n=1 Tax=Brevibacillus borstelensis TaxID=45462 RepID=UPI00204194B5|nr:NAD(P)/FAD-dependent oxidoreductase [Brevibacillus borstelensis]MCM3470399.1 NAD(P)/FAD-dependent oxidoreductase [Brevibacillus borstelensis]MCM3623188.1 NAD(P)/FAD-dependent oxidoreductase [Brevibacillus borstelensis]